MSEADTFWASIVGPVSHARGIAGLTPLEARLAYDEVKGRQLTDVEIEEIVHEVVSGQLSVWDLPPEGSWLTSVDSELQKGGPLLASQGLTDEKDEDAVDEQDSDLDNLGNDEDELS